MTTREKLDEQSENTDETRNRISDDLRAIGEKLSPQHIKEELKDATVGKLRDAKDSMSDAGRATVGYARQNAIPLALIGAGVGWLLASRRNGGREQRQWTRDMGEVGREI